jgi:hypothetical protein
VALIIADVSEDRIASSFIMMIIIIVTAVETSNLTELIVCLTT